jgi:hypothetical protein
VKINRYVLSPCPGLIILVKGLPVGQEIAYDPGAGLDVVAMK